MKPIIDYPIDYTKYLDVQEIMNYYRQWGFDKLVLITDNGTGKTYTATNWVMETLLEGQNACWIRNTELEADKCVNGLTAGLLRHGMTEDYLCKKDGIYYITERTGTGKPKSMTLRCPIVYLSSLAKSIPQEIHAKLIVIDEFIDGSSSRKFVLKDYAADLKKAVSRLIRPVDPAHPVTTIALANPHEPTSDLLQALGIDFDWDLLYKGKVSYAYNEGTHTAGLCIPKQFNIQEMESTYSYWGGEEGVRENYKFNPSTYKRIGLIDDDCVDWEGRLSVCRQFFAYGTWKDGNGGVHMYVRKCRPTEFEDMRPVAMLPSDVFDDAYYYTDMRDRMAKFYKVVRFLMSNDVYFDCEFTREKFKQVNALVGECTVCGYL